MDPIEVKKSEIESYIIEWDCHNNWLYLTVKVVRLFRKRGEITKKKYKNMVAFRGVDQTLPEPLQQSQLKESKRTWQEVKKAVDKAFQNMPKKKVEF